MRDSQVDESVVQQELQVVTRPPQPQGTGNDDAAQMQNAALFQSQLLSQMLQVGSLFS